MTAGREVDGPPSLVVLALDREPGRKQTLYPLYELENLRRAGVPSVLESINFDLGSGNTSRANKLGREYVAKGAKFLDPETGAMISECGMRIYRPPSQKTFRPGVTSDRSPTKFQANYILLDAPGGNVIANGHYDIMD